MSVLRAVEAEVLAVNVSDQRKVGLRERIDFAFKPVEGKEMEGASEESEGSGGQPVDLSTKQE